MKRWFLLLLLLPAGARATVTNPTYSVTYTCSGSTGPYSFTFPISEPAAITVTKAGTLLTPTTDYTVAPVNNNYANGGSVTLVAACTSSLTIAFVRQTPITQTSVFTDNMPVPMKSFESGLDKLTQIDQELNGTLATKGGTGTCDVNEYMTAISTSGVTCATVTGSGLPSPPAYAVQFAGPGATTFNADAFININPATHTFSTGVTGENASQIPGLNTGRFPGSVDCALYGGSDVGVKANNCITATLTAAGVAPGTIVADMTNLLAGNTTKAEEITIGNGTTGAIVRLPANSLLTDNMNGGPAFAAAVYPTAYLASAGGSSNVLGDILTVVEPAGFPYTNLGCTGATFTVTGVSGGAVTALTLLAGGQNCLTSNFVVTTSNNGGATPPIIMLRAHDCGLRIMNGSILLGDSVGGGTYSAFAIQPGTLVTGTPRMSAAVCGDENAHYIKVDGSIRTLSSPAANDSAFTDATAVYRTLDDHSLIKQPQPVATQDNGFHIDGMTGSAEVEMGHSGNQFKYANPTNAGVGAWLGSGGTLLNACTTSGSPTVTVPYGHFTAKWLGFHFGSQGYLTQGSIITAINSFTSVTLNQNATATTGGQTACASPVTPPNGVGLSGVDLYGSDPVAPGIYAATLSNPVANDAGPGLPNVDIEGANHLLLSDETYAESHTSGSAGSTTGVIYISSAVHGLAIQYLTAGDLSYPTMPCIWSDTPFNWEADVMCASFIMDNGVAVPNPYASGYQQLWHYVSQPTTFQAANGAPDTNFRNGFWTLGGGLSVAQSPSTGGNALTYTLTGTPTSLAAYTTTPIPAANLTAGATYSISAFINLSGATIGSYAGIKLCYTDVESCTDIGTPDASGALITYGQSARSCRSFTMPNPITGPVYIVMAFNTLAGSGKVYASDVMFNAGKSCQYVPNEGPSAFTATSFFPLPAVGIAILSSGTQTVTNAAACTPSATCVYKLTNCAVNGSSGIGTLSVGTVSAGVSFVINSLGPTASVLVTDASSVCWQIN